MPSYKTKAIIIKRRNQGESDRVLTLFSRDFGKISAIAKGARKAKSKLAGSCELFTEAEFILSPGKTFDIVVESAPCHFCQAESTDLDLVNLAHFFAEVTISVSIERQPSEAVYEALSESLTKLGEMDSRLIEIYFCSRILSAIGSYPELSACLACGKKPENEVLFSHSAGGIFCADCKPTAESLFFTSRDLIKFWRFITESDITKINRIKVNDEIIAETAEVSRTFLCSITGKDFCTIHNLKLTGERSSGII